MLSAMSVLSGTREAGCCREVAALYSDHYICIYRFHRMMQLLISPAL